MVIVFFQYDIIYKQMKMAKIQLIFLELCVWKKKCFFFNFGLVWKKMSIINTWKSQLLYTHIRFKILSNFTIITYFHIFIVTFIIDLLVIN